MSELIEHSVEIRPGIRANTVGPIILISEMYPVWESGSDVTDNSEQTIALGDGYELRIFNSSLRFEESGDSLAVLGNTKTSTCAVAIDCGSCALAGSELSTTEMAMRNCARANTAEIFSRVGQGADGAFMLLPTSDESLVVGSGDYDVERNGALVMQNRLRSASSVVFTESWIREKGLSEISIGMNGADGSFGVAVTEVEGEKLFIPFCSMRPNMGDRPENKQILRQALNAYFDSQDFDERKRQEIIASLKISVTLSASASLAYFAHKIQIPDDESTYAQKLRNDYPELIEQAGGVITPRIVLHEQYAGALERGAIFPEFEAQLGVQSDPYSPTACPMDGQTCHVDYRSETEYALRSQLTSMGVVPENINYSDEFALDPSDPSNNMASNRREQNNGVATPMTNRTINGIKVVLPKN